MALTPHGAASLVRDGHEVLVERGAGLGSGFPDDQYVGQGARMVDGPAAVFGEADMVVKVKEPLESEYSFLRPGLVLFTYLHLAAEPALTQALLDAKVTGIGYETVETDDGLLPLLTPMSEIAGRLSIQVGAHYLERRQGGAGKLIAGVPGVPPATVVILGAGTAGGHAAAIAVGMGAHVQVVGLRIDRLRLLAATLDGNVETIISTPETVREAVEQADLVVGAVLIAGASAPKIVDRKMVGNMARGSVIVDISIDQGGCCETSRPTSHSDPVYVVDEVIHYCVTNMPGAVPNTSTRSLCNATLPHVLALARHGFEEATRRDQALARGVNTLDGRIAHPALAEEMGS